MKLHIFIEKSIETHWITHWKSIVVSRAADNKKRSLSWLAHCLRWYFI